MLVLKDGVSLRLMKPQMMIALSVADSVYKEHGLDCVVTSGNDSNHMVGSKHYTGEAFDIRTRNVKEKYLERSPVFLSRIHERIRLALGCTYGNEENDNFDIVLESDHIHIEYDPKGSSARPHKSRRAQGV